MPKLSARTEPCPSNVRLAQGTKPLQEILSEALGLMRSWPPAGALAPTSPSAAAARPACGAAEPLLANTAAGGLHEGSASGLRMRAWMAGMHHQPTKLAERNWCSCKNCSLTRGSLSCLCVQMGPPVPTMQRLTRTLQIALFFMVALGKLFPRCTCGSFAGW